VFLIFGLSVFFRTTAEGAFHCPACGGDRGYRQRTARRWFTLFFLPVIPLNRLGEVIECRACRTRHAVGVLRLPTAARMAEVLPVAMRAATVAVLAAGDPSDSRARARAVDAVCGYGGGAYGDEALDADLSDPPRDADEMIAKAGAQLTIEAREWFFAQVVRVALADGAITGGERRVLHDVALRLGMTAAHALGVITTTEGAARE
jgi:hypothetical protein